MNLDPILESIRQEIRQELDGTNRDPATVLGELRQQHTDTIIRQVIEEELVRFHGASRFAREVKTREICERGHDPRFSDEILDRIWEACLDGPNLLVSTRDVWARLARLVSEVMDLDEPVHEQPDGAGFSTGHWD